MCHRPLGFRKVAFCWLLGRRVDSLDIVDKFSFYFRGRERIFYRSKICACKGVLNKDRVFLAGEEEFFCSFATGTSILRTYAKEQLAKE